MNTPFDALPQGSNRIVYVRPVQVADLPEEVRAQIEGTDVIYSVHAPDGQRLALVADRSMAFHLARAHDFAPVNVH
ncbi:DUF1150 family protein [Rhodobacter sp. SGA-6-6]|uniref:DUF1150 family protein n=1 Tax=Rhodobacter sp. SGA-6-6 TaxID=2710882 RepID=UPI0013EDA347|nr:DUF1150 family protein [Rhodobacter sp. SGA-6-6]NGM44929.1 DUF1150 family protein [Rhodobacter sp. SGA-6-6]